MSTSVSGISSSAVALPSVASGQAAKTTSAANGSAASALNRLLAKYKASLARGQTPNDLASLARQINSAAKALGQHVTSRRLLPGKPMRATDKRPRRA